MDREPAIQLRPAGRADCRQIWEWRNEPVAREASFNSAEIPFDAHTRWFADKLAGHTTRFYIVTVGAHEDVGYVRFDLHGEIAELSVCLAPESRSRGVGQTIIRTGAELVLRDGIARRVVAVVKQDNAASRRAFEAAGFTAAGHERRGGVDAVVFHYPLAAHD